MQAPGVAATHVAMARRGVGRVGTAWRRPTVIDCAGHALADDASERNTARRPAAGAAHAYTTFVDTLAEAGRDHAARRLIEFRARESDPVGGAAGAA